MGDELQLHARLLRWDAWANREALAALEGLAPPQALRWMAHIAGAELLWLARLRGETSSLPVWPELGPEEIAAHLDRLRLAWPEYLATLEDEDLADAVGYRNSRGEFWTSTVRDILTQVVSHSAYHRGQIAAAVRAAGGQPVLTDFIHASRQGMLE